MEGGGKGAAALLVLLLVAASLNAGVAVAAARRLGEDGGGRRQQPPPLVSVSKASSGPSGCSNDPHISGRPCAPPKMPDQLTKRAMDDVQTTHHR
uniref:Uncharacterized protein n=7 Tax=Oryza TaxID=4527 RepID=Q6ERC5_ORYSJ|nr:hypothetical protein [Oryza sativa Japonica Group]BAD28795.1 hypothetical protein [Oryza sativa Japonica Group]